MAHTAVYVCLLVCLSLTAVQGAASHHRRADDVPALQTVVSGHSEQLTQQDARITALQASLTQLQQRLQQQHDQSSLQVAFHARASSTAILHRNDMFRFDLVSTNVASAYDPQTGIFTAPVAGVYVFLFSTRGISSFPASAYLTVNGQNEVFVDDTDEMGTGHGTFHLNQGERVWVASNADNLHSYSYNTYFTGFLLHRDS